MNIYRLTRNDRWSYDDYDSIIVIAKDEKAAVNISPDNKPVNWSKPRPCWVDSPILLDVELIGTAKEGVVECCILASFNAG
jgi:hypothetical protein